MQMGHPLAGVYSLLYWRPKYWKDFTFKRYLWRETHNGYDEIIREEHNLRSLLSKGKYDEYILKRAFHLYLNISSAWHAIEACRMSFNAIRCQNLRITLEERAIYEEYRRTSYIVFYRCRKLFLDAQVMAGKITRARRDEQMREIEVKWGFADTGKARLYCIGYELCHHL